MEGIVKCCACGFMNIGFEYLTFTTSRGTNDRWLQCRNCCGYFLSVEYDAATESGRAGKTSYGDEKTGKELNRYKHRMFNFSLEQVKEFSPPPGKLLDIGGSYGGFLFLAKTAGYDVEGTDIVPSAVEYVKNKDIPMYLCYSVKELDENKRYDIITALDCNYYWPDQPAELSEIYRRLNQNGLFVMRVVDKSWTVRMGISIKRLLHGFGNKIIRRGLNDHRFSMPAQSLIKLLDERGFQLLKVSVKGAQHSEESSFGVKLSFTLGEIIYKLTGRFFAPGEVLVLRKKSID